MTAPTESRAREREALVAGLQHVEMFITCMCECADHATLQRMVGATRGAVAALEAADADARRMREALAEIAFAPCVASLLGESQEECGCPSCRATNTLAAYDTNARAAEEPTR